MPALTADLFFFAVMIVYIWNSLPVDVVEPGTYNLIKKRMCSLNLNVSDCYIDFNKSRTHDTR
jgi:hypothetical protein